MSTTASQDIPRRTTMLRRLRLQWRLSTLLIAVAVFCLWLAHHANRIHGERRAIHELKRLGLTVTLASNAPDWAPNWLDKIWFQYVVGVNVPHWASGVGRDDVELVADPTLPLSNIELFFLFPEPPRHDAAMLSDDAMRNIAAFKYCKALYLPNAQIGDAGLRRTLSMPHLQMLYLQNTQITDGLAQLTRLRHLRCVNIAGTHVTDAGAASLARALPDCQICR